MNIKVALRKVDEQRSIASLIYSSSLAIQKFHYNRQISPLAGITYNNVLTTSIEIRQCISLFSLVAQSQVEVLPPMNDRSYTCAKLDLLGSEWKFNDVARLHWTLTAMAEEEADRPNHTRQSCPMRQLCWAG